MRSFHFPIRARFHISTSRELIHPPHNQWVTAHHRGPPWACPPAGKAIPQELIIDKHDGAAWIGLTPLPYGNQVWIEPYQTTVFGNSFRLEMHQQCAELLRQFKPEVVCPGHREVLYFAKKELDAYCNFIERKEKDVRGSGAALLAPEGWTVAEDFQSLEVQSQGHGELTFSVMSECKKLDSSQHVVRF